MGFKVRCKLIDWGGDEELFPCHFGYKIGDEFIFDGEKFIGRICPGIFYAIAPVITPIHNTGNKYHREIPWRYSGLSVKDPSMKKYNGYGFRVIKEPPLGADNKQLHTHDFRPETEKKGGWIFACGDARTSALFSAEPFGLAELGWYTPYFMRQMNILEKIKKEPGITQEGILDRFTAWEKETIYPPLTPLILGILLDEMVTVNLVEVREGKHYPKGP